MKSLGYGLSDLGSKRTNNEDFLLVNDDLGLYVVCDGLGGHSAGEVAASLAASTAEKVVRDQRHVLMQVLHGETGHAELANLARQAVREASRVVFEEATRNRDCAGMGTTMTLLLVAGTKGAMGHVGDTRLYLCRDDTVSLLSTDHTLAAEAVRRGELPRERESTDQLSRVLTRMVGAQNSVEVDSLVFDLQAGDRLLICSDGLTEYLQGSSELTSHLAPDDPVEIPRALVELANSRGGGDNVTVLVVVFETSDEEQKQLLQIDHQINSQLDALRGVEFFSRVRFVDLLRLHGMCERQESAAGDVIVQEGDAADRLCVVVRGRYSLDAGDIPLRDMGPGDHVGDTTLLVQRACRSVLRAVEPGQLLTLPGSKLRALARRRPFLGVSILLQLAEKLSRELAAAGDVLVEEVSRKPEEMRRLPRPLKSFLTLWKG